MLSMIAAAALAGMLGTPHCLGMCGGFAAVCSRRRGGAWAWHAGRTLSYVTLGVVAGAAGATLGRVGAGAFGVRWLAPAVSVLLLSWFAASLAGVVPASSVRVPGLSRLASRAAREEGIAWRVLFGVATGLLPCGMVYAALAMAVSAGSAAAGALTMLAFAIGTMPGLALMAVAVQRFVAHSLWRRRAVALLVLATGLWTVGQRTVRGAANQHAHHSVHPSFR